MPQVQADGKYEDRVRKWQGLASYVHIKKEDSSCCLVPEEQRGELARARQDSAQEPMAGEQDGGRGGCGEGAGGVHGARAQFPFGVMRNFWRRRAAMGVQQRECIYGVSVRACDDG